MPAKITRATSAVLLGIWAAIGLCVPAFTSGPPDMTQMQMEADSWIISNSADAKGSPLELQMQLMGASNQMMIDIYGQNWPAVAAYVDTALQPLPNIAASTLGEPFATLGGTGEAASVFEGFAQQEGTLLLARLYEPEMLGAFGYTMLAGAKLEPAEFARSSVVSSYLSSNLFTTDFNGQPAIGLTSGLWTVVTAYTRNQHGLPVPSAIAMYPRKKQE